MSMGGFDEGVLKAMSDLVVSVNRLKHAESRSPSSYGDPTLLRRLAAEERKAEESLAAELQARGWLPPHRALRVGA